MSKNFVKTLVNLRQFSRQSFQLKKNVEKTLINFFSHSKSYYMIYYKLLKLRESLNCLLNSFLNLTFVETFAKI